MDLVDEQFQALKERGRYGGATLARQGNGTAVVTVPNVDLPVGWSKTKVTVYFVVPVGYPMAKPDCFWVDSDLRLGSGAMPANTGTTAGHGVPDGALWFSWHANVWNANKDTLVTYMGMIVGRLKEVR